MIGKRIIADIVGRTMAEVLWIESNQNNPKHIRYYKGKYKIIILKRIRNKSYVVFLEKGIVGNQKMGYREAKRGEHIFLYTRSCWRNKKL